MTGRSDCPADASASLGGTLQHATKEVRSTSRTLLLPRPRTGRATKPEDLEPISYYDKMRLLEARPDDEPN